MQKFLNNYGMLLVLVALCILFSALTLHEQIPEGPAAVDELARQIADEYKRSDLILTVGTESKTSTTLANSLERRLNETGFTNTRTITGQPRDLRLALEEASNNGMHVAALAGGGDVAKWHLVDQIPSKFPVAANFNVFTPKPYIWPDFLKQSNLMAIVDRIVVIAVIAIGMTMVIITAGIDLSVGSLVALSAVTATFVMKRLGGLQASDEVVLVGFLAGIAVCGIIGALGGFIVAQFKVAPFITTLAIMMIGRGMAFLITGGFSIYQVPAGLPWLGQGRTIGIPNTVILLLVLFASAHLFMTYSRWGRYIYAVGGNEEAARLSGVPVKTVVVLVYVVSAIAAGLGGCIQASQLNSGTPNMGMMYELYVIAAVVVGGTSLAGGSGRILGTLIGAFIISVIQNGMNLVGMDSYTQQVVLGAVILGAVLLDKVRSSGRFTMKRWAN